MNLSEKDSDICKHHFEECDPNIGFSSSMMSLPNQIIGLISGTELIKESQEDKEIHKKLMVEVESKIAPVMKNMVELTKAHEISKCGYVSDKTELLERMYSGSTMTLDIPKIDLMGMSNTTDNYEFGRKLLNFLAISLVIYMFAKLILR